MRFAYPAILLFAAACASAPSAARSTVTNADPRAGSVEAPAALTPLRGTMLTGSFTTEYFAGETLHDVLRRRLPLFLRARTASAADLTGRSEPISVFLDGSYAGSLEVLSLVPASHVFSVQRMSGGEAAVKLGPRHRGGALLVTMVRR
jgi:hypothetical protein